MTQFNGFGGGNSGGGDSSPGTIPTYRVVARTTTTLAANTYANGASGVGATLTADANGAFAAIDGQTITVGQSILVADEASQLKNGIYTLTNAGSAGTPWVLTRATFSDTSAELYPQLVFVQSGSSYGDTLWTQSTASPIVGTDSIVYAEVGGATVPNVDAIYYVDTSTEAVLPNTPTYNNGASGVGATLTASVNGALGTIGGLATALNTSVLVQNQVDQKQNGVYTVSDVGSVSTPYILTRLSNYDEPSEIQSSLVIVQSGTYANQAYIQKTNPIVAVGTSNIVYQPQTIPVSATPPYISGKTIYVDKNANVATDTRTGLASNKYTRDRPFQTIQAAITAAASGDNIHIEDNDYTENLTITGKSLIIYVGEGVNIIGNWTITSALSISVSLNGFGKLTGNISINGAGNGIGLLVNGPMTITGDISGAANGDNVNLKGVKSTGNIIMVSYTNTNIVINDTETVGNLKGAPITLKNVASCGAITCNGTLKFTNVRKITGLIQPDAVSPGALYITGINSNMVVTTGYNIYWNDRNTLHSITLLGCMLYSGNEDNIRMDDTNQVYITLDNVKMRCGTGKYNINIAKTLLLVTNLVLTNIVRNSTYNIAATATYDYQDLDRITTQAVLDQYFTGI